ncbi:hypothetical protein KW785_02230 [Candidatus Parcubacteria bacterium]|nr:hypothetical protein [Candidatus Parcubacteria bacterium]
MPDSRKYIFAFLITAVIFGTAIFVSNYFSQKRINAIQSIEDRISLDILASETQYALLQETSCKNTATSTLSKDLGDLSQKLSIAEEQNGADDPSVLNLKKQYSLLEIKDYLLMKSITAKCGNRPTFILYFYSNEGDCPDCQKMGYVLTALHDTFPDLRIYSFDFNLDLEAVHTLRSIYGLSATLPALVVNSDPYYGFQPLDELIKDVPALARLKAALDRARAATSTATTTSKKK